MTAVPPGSPGVGASPAPPPGVGASTAPPPGVGIGQQPTHRDVGEATLGELVGDVTRDLSTLMRQELALAQAELRQEAATTGKAAGALGGAGFAGYMTVLFLSIALWSGLTNLMDAGWAALIVAVLWAVIGAVLYVTGRRKLQEVRSPHRTVDTLKQVPDALKGHRGGTP